MTQQFSDASSLERLAEIRQQVEDNRKLLARVATIDATVAQLLRPYERHGMISMNDVPLYEQREVSALMQEADNIMDHSLGKYETDDVAWLLEQCAEAIKAREAAERDRDALQVRLDGWDYTDAKALRAEAARLRAAAERLVQEWRARDKRWDAEADKLADMGDTERMRRCLGIAQANYLCAEELQAILSLAQEQP